MSTLREAAQQALEALELAQTDVHWELNSPTRKFLRKAEKTLRSALAQQAEPDAYGYAARLAVAIWEKHYKDTAPQWKPLDYLIGVLTQIDNMTSGLTRQAQQAEPVQEPVAKVELMTTGGNAGLATRIVEIDDHLRERLRPGQLLYTAPPRCPNCASLEAQNAELDRKLAQLEQAEPSQEPVATLIAQRDALLEALIKCRDRFFPADQPERDRDELWEPVTAAIKAVEGEKT